MKLDFWTKAKAPPKMGHNPPPSKEERMFILMMNDIFKRQTADAARNVKKVLNGEKVELVDRSRWIPEIAELTEGLRFVPFKRGGDEAISDLYKVKKQFGLTEWIEDPAVLQAVREESFMFARTISDKTADDLQAALYEGVKAGESVAQIEKRVVAVNGAWRNSKRSMMIARTETSRAYTQGQIAAWEQTGVVTEKVWSAASDSCPFCAAMNGKVIGLKEDYLHNGDVLSVSAGGDRTASLRMGYGNVNGPPLHPNCRCSIVAHVVTGRDVGVQDVIQVVKPSVSRIPKPVLPMTSAKEMIRKYPELKKIKVIETPSFGDTMLGRYDEKGTIYLSKKEAQAPFRKIADAKDGTPPFNRFRGREATLTHEYAHVLDYELGGGIGEGVRISDSVAWTKGFDKYLTSYLDHPRGGQVISRYSRSNVRELFAESVTAYTKDPLWLKKINPDMFNLVESTLKETL